jgi:nucleotide-binding universal stress UspA family protein
MSGIFERVVCGVDRSEAGEAAARVAARVADPDGSLLLLSIDDPTIAVHAGWRAAAIADELDEEARVALERATGQALPAHAVETRLVEGDPLRSLLGEIERRDATLAVVGTHEHHRAVGIALGSVATYLLHETPCSVLIARVPRDAQRWPRSIVVGIDGSAESSAAAEAARALADRSGADVRYVVGTADRVDLDAARVRVPEVEEHESGAVDLLSVLSERADLLVVGSRGLKGARALGSVSERVAHQAHCSVLAVRGSV